MEQACSRFKEAERHNLARWAARKVQEEAGHDQLALRDLRAMGYRAEAVVEALFPPAAKTLVEFFTRSVQSRDPIDCLSYSYTAERLGICIGDAYIQKVEALLPPRVNATRCLRVHSAVGSEVEHVKEMVAMITELTLQERNFVAKACHQAASIRFSPPKAAYISDAELQHILKPLELVNNYE